MASKRTHCQKGHALTPDNVYEDRREGGIVVLRCKTCIRAYQREYDKLSKELGIRKTPKKSGPKVYGGTVTLNKYGPEHFALIGKRGGLRLTQRETSVAVGTATTED